MSLFSALNSAQSGLRTVQANVKVVSDNITRVDDPNRSRHTLQQKIDSSGLVVTAEYRREVDAGLRGQVEQIIARESRTETQTQYMEKLGDLLRTTSGKPLLNEYADKFAAAWRSLETTPESEVARFQLVDAANIFAREINRVSEGVEDLDRQMREDAERSIIDLNRMLRDVNNINDDIVALGALGSAANEVADKRDSLVRQISELIEVRTVQRPDGRVALFTPSGLALVDSEPAVISYDGGNVNLVNGSRQESITGHMSQGRIGALFEMRYDGSALATPRNPSPDPAAEVIRKLRSQLDALADAFVAKTKDGEPTSFADAYNDASPIVTGELSNNFFVGSDRFTLAVNDKLLKGELSIKTSAIDAVVVSINKASRSLTADGLDIQDATYSGMVSAITGNWMAISNRVNTTHEFDVEARRVLEERYHGKVGINLDEEIALLQQLQTSYGASARVMQVTLQMYDTLESIVR